MHGLKFDCSLVLTWSQSLEVGVETSLVAALIAGVCCIQMFALGMDLQSSVSCSGIMTLSYTGIS